MLEKGRRDYYGKAVAASRSLCVLGFLAGVTMLWFDVFNVYSTGILLLLGNNNIIIFRILYIYFNIINLEELGRLIHQNLALTGE